MKGFSDYILLFFFEYSLSDTQKKKDGLGSENTKKKSSDKFCFT